MSDKTSDKLLSCPFCGGESELLVGNTCHWVFCKRCGNVSGQSATIEDAIRKWNTRKPMERIVERLEEEKKWYSDKAKEELEEFYLEMFHHYTDEALGLEKAIEIVKEEMG